MVNLVVIGMFFAVVSSFFMGLFFFISAYFLPGSLDRRGTQRFLRDRLIRLGIPLLVLTLTVLPAIGYVFYVPRSISFTDFYLHSTIIATGDPSTFSFGYLWFVVILILFALLYTFLRQTKVTLPHAPFPDTQPSSSWWLCVLSLQWMLITVDIPSLGKFFLVGAAAIRSAF